MNRFDFRLLWLAAAAVVIVTACGGGGGGTSSAAPVANATGVARGTITGFGSVYLNGTRYDTASASFSSDGEDATQGDLSVGMVVKIRGDIEGQHASRVEFVEDVKGPVDEVLPDGLRVMGQVVLIDATTKVDPSLDLATVAPGDLVEVSGLRDANDQIDASFVEGKDPATVRSYKVVGQVRDLDAMHQSFRVGGLTVDYSTAQFDDFTESDLANAQLVEVKDDNKAYNAGDLRLVATDVDLDSNVRMEDEDDIHHQHDDGDDAKVEGLITQIVDASHFVVAGSTVTITDTTTFAFGDATNLMVGAEVEVHGTLAADGSITAIKIEFQHTAARAAGIVEAVDAVGGSLKVFGVTIEPVADARFKDNRDHVTPFELVDVKVGDFIDARGVQHDNSILAHEIERNIVDGQQHGGGDDTQLRGAASNIDATKHTLTILGVVVVTDASTEYKGKDERSTSVTDFFAALHDGQTPVDARWQGSVTDPTVPVKELSVEED